MCSADSEVWTAGDRPVLGVQRAVLGVQRGVDGGQRGVDGGQRGVLGVQRGVLGGAWRAVAGKRAAPGFRGEAGGAIGWGRAVGAHVQAR